MKYDYLLEDLNSMFPDACCELIYHNNYELLVAVMLSAQTTDKAVNKVTPFLFSKYPDIESLAKADLVELIDCIKTLGLYRNKSKNLLLMANDVCSRFNGLIPSDLASLTSLPGVGRKTANVYLAIYCNVPRIPVDTHVYRVSKRIGLVAAKASVLQTEEKLMKLFPEDKWLTLHHQLIFLGRYVCKAVNPQCSSCKISICKERIKLEKSKNI